jgi:hypothetical protein
VVLSRGPTLREMPDAAPTECEPQAQSAPEYEFDQRIPWWLDEDPISLVGGALVPWVAESASAAAPATHGTIGLWFWRDFQISSPRSSRMTTAHTVP